MYEASWPSSGRRGLRHSAHRAAGAGAGATSRRARTEASYESVTCGVPRDSGTMSVVPCGSIDALSSEQDTNAGLMLSLSSEAPAS